VTEDERLLLAFVVWLVRIQDLPPNVREAAFRVAATHKYERPPGSYGAGGWRVTLFDPDDAVEPVSAQPLAVGAYVDNLLAEHPDLYALLIQRVPDEKR
jgi:hypothetical protein